MSSPMSLMVSLLFFVVALGAGCVDSTGDTPWGIAVSEVQGLAEAVDAAGDVDALAPVGDELTLIAADLTSGQNAKGTLTDTACASLGARWRGAAVGAPKKSFAQKLGNFAKGAFVGVLAVLPHAVEYRSALEAHAAGNFGDTPGLNGGDMISKMQSFGNDLDALVTVIAETGMNRELVGLTSFEPGMPGEQARKLLAHEAAHVVQQRMGGKAPDDLQKPLDKILELDRLDLAVQAALTDFTGSLSDIQTKLDLLLDSDRSCLATTPDHIAALVASVDNASRRFQTLSNASKARHDIALNAIRNMK